MLPFGLLVFDWIFFSFLQVTRTTIKALMSLIFGGIPPLTSELAAFERLKNQTISLLALYRLHFTPGIYAEVYIVFVSPFVRLYVRSFVLPSRL